jgi:SAM-dependent methyltransferase
MIRWLVQSPVLYDVVQQLAGERELQKRLAPYLHVLPADRSVIDIGGGTGLVRRLLNTNRYVCLDLELQKLRRFRSHGGGLAVAGDATACPFSSASFDVVLCTKVFHHLSDAQLRATLAEIHRMLRPGGMLIAADPVRSDRWMSRVLWRLDRGSFPRTAAEIRRSLPAEYRVEDWEQFRLAIFHDFVLCAARRTQALSRRLRTTVSDVPGDHECPTN